MADDVTRTPRDLVHRGTDGVVQADPSALADLPPGAVRLQAAGLTDDALASAGDPVGIEGLRGAVRALVLAGHDVELSAPLAGADTTPVQLLQGVTELAHLALWHPGSVRFEPIESVDVPDDAWVRGVLAQGIVDPGDHYTASLARLREAAESLHATVADADRLASETMLRRLDDAPRRALFHMLSHAWLADTAGWPGPPLDKPRALQVAVDVLGDTERWMKRFRQFTYDGVRRLVVIPTWQCELRCSYCWIPKQDGRVMDVATMERAIEMLMVTEQPTVMLQFFGGEALLEWSNVQHGITYAQRRAAEEGKDLEFVLSSNGWSLTPDKVAWLADHPVKLELSLDGDPRTQTRYRPSRWKGTDSYEHSIAANAEAILASGLDQYVIMVVHPTNVDAMPANFFHIADLGFRHIQINIMLGRVWKPHELESFASGLHEIGREMIRRWGEGEALEFINMRHRPMAMRLNGEVTVDWDGTIFGGNGFLHETEHKDKFAIAHLDDATGVDRYWIDATDNAFLLDWSYRPKVTANNVEVGRVMASFVRWMTEQGYGPEGPRATQSGAA